VLEAGTLLFNEVLLPTVEPDAVAAHVRRFMAGSTTVAGLDREAVLDEPRLEYFPFWAFTLAGVGGSRQTSEMIVLEPAAPSALQGLSGLTVPAGRTEPMRAELLGTAVAREPEVPLETARTWLLGRWPGAEVARTVLYHVPLYLLGYTYRGRSYVIAVEGVTGRVLSADFPAKAETPFRLVACLALLVFGLEGLVVSNLLVKLGLFIISAPPLLTLAWWVSRRV